MNAHELYQLIVGEGSCSASYFFNEMGINEAVDFIKGLNRRHRQSWEQSRMLGRLICAVITGEEFDLSFPWDDENDDEEEGTEEEYDALRLKAKEMEKRMNGGKNE